jgi:hypothetical protein
MGQPVAGQKFRSGIVEAVSLVALEAGMGLIGPPAFLDLYHLIFAGSDRMARLGFARAGVQAAYVW